MYCSASIQELLVSKKKDRTTASPQSPLSQDAHARRTTEAGGHRHPAWLAILGEVAEKFLDAPIAFPIVAPKAEAGTSELKFDAAEQKKPGRKAELNCKASSGCKDPLLLKALVTSSRRLSLHRPTSCPSSSRSRL